MAIERRLHDAALHASPAAVDEAHFAETGRSRRVDEFGDDRWNVARDKRVQIELAANRDIDRELAVSHKSQIASDRAAVLI